jgi:hypothetical protein
MVHQSVIQARLDNLGVRLSRWYKPELKELAVLLMDDEEIISAVTGRYFGGFALLVATDRRILLIDKKTIFMSLEDIRYDMISEIDYRASVIDATISIFTVNKHHRFVSVKHRAQMRLLTNYAQKRVMEIRQPQTAQQLAREMDDDSETNKAYDYTPGDGLQQEVSTSTPAEAYQYGPANAQTNAAQTYQPSGRGISAHLRTVGTAAIRGAHLSVINPYTQAPLTSRHSWIGFGKPSTVDPGQVAKPL